ncbi:hypothetical protein GCM10029976_093340 [Kribbella albertanoniae]|uniref:Uncharacterized protein n=1 Tax=Kribbella albertanoniae TaxID=1266829 RepID=A0A4R4Q2I8_9ACTN|nr:hypothetical protein [Kribbella albertanoniae]TDC29042.1 hypothetical protein E1261_16730 [Kribbella albertanoniae]
MRSRLSLLSVPAIAAVLLAGTPTTSAVPAPSSVTTSSAVPAAAPIEVDPAQTRRFFTDWGFDLKQLCPFDAAGCTRVAERFDGQPESWRGAEEQAAREITGSGQVTVLRVPLRPDKMGFAPEAGGTKYYAPVIGSIRNLRAAAPDPAAIKVFASFVTVTDCPDNGPSCPDFPDWMKEDGYPVPERYGSYVVQYLNHFQAAGTPIDILGIMNEPGNNESPDKPPASHTWFFRVVRYVQDNYPAARMPKFIGNDASHPDNGFLGGLSADDWSRLSIASTHHQAAYRTADRLVELREFAGQAHDHGKPVWDTEFHYDAGDPERPEFQRAARGLYTGFDHFDQGFTGITWWAYRPPCGPGIRPATGTDHGPGTSAICQLGSKPQIRSALIRSTAHSRPLLGIVDGDGSAATPGTVTTRAFRRGPDLFLWVINDTATSYPGRPISIRGHRVPVAPQIDRWTTGADPEQLVHTSAAGTTQPDGTAQVPLPARSISLVRFPDLLTSSAER